MTKEQMDNIASELIKQWVDSLRAAVEQNILEGDISNLINFLTETIAQFTVKIILDIDKDLNIPLPFIYKLIDYKVIYFLEEYVFDKLSPEQQKGAKEMHEKINHMKEKTFSMIREIIGENEQASVVH